MEVILDRYWLEIFKTLNESQKRWFSAQKSLEMGHGGISYVSKLTSMSRTTITKGIDELKLGKGLGKEVRKKGSGRKKITVTNPKITEALDLIMDQTTAGDPMSTLKWTCKSTRNISDELARQGIQVSYRTVYTLLSNKGYTLQGNKKSLGSHSDNPSRDEQFRYINERVKDFINAGQPVISVDTKKKEQVGNFKNNGTTWRKKKDPKKVHDHDFPSLGIGVAIPYGTYDVVENEGFVNVGVTADTAEFAVNSIRQWWYSIGVKKYAKAKEILICADGGGSNSSRSRTWKFNLQKLADQIGLNITVCHYPPGTSKWNKIEHRMFSFISMNWKGKPLETYQMIINLIGNTTTKKGLRIQAKLDVNKYEKGIKVSDEELDAIKLKFHENNPKWNYTILHS